MKRESWSITFACALGALIGTFVALDISTRFQYGDGEYFWSFGALLGGIISYIAVDFRHFCAGVAHSYRKIIAWRLSIVRLRVIGARCVLATIFASVFCGGMVLITTPLLILQSGAFLGIFWNIIVPAYLATLLVGISVILISGIFLSQTSEEMEVEMETAWDIIRLINPVPVASILSRSIVKGVMRSPKIVIALWSTLNTAGKTFGKFVTDVFVYVHSDRRTLCFVDAALGTGVGYFFDSAIIGAIVGALLGLVNYELVSVRWLKLVPIKPQSD